MYKPLGLLIPILFCLPNCFFGQAFSVTASASNSTICLGNSSTLTATASPISYTGSAIPYNPIPSMGINILCSGGALDPVNPITPSFNLSGVNFLDDSRWDNIDIPFPFTYFWY
jgi:hypothetical protein